MDIVRRETLHGRVQMLLPSVCSEELERELVCEAQAGSSAAFDHLMSLHEKRVFRAAMRIAGNYEDAKDIAQNTFLKAFVHLRQFRGNSRFSTWPTRIAKNEALMAKRRRLAVEVPLGISPEGDDTRGRMEPRDREPNPEQVTVNAQLFQILAVRLRKVSPELQALVYLRYFEEVPVANTARKLGISPAAVKSRCHRVFKQFQAFMTRKPRRRRAHQ